MHTQLCSVEDSSHARSCGVRRKRVDRRWSECPRPWDYVDHSHDRGETRPTAHSGWTHRYLYRSTLSQASLRWVRFDLLLRRCPDMFGDWPSGTSYFLKQSYGSREV